MKKSLSIIVLVFLFMLAGCGTEPPNTSDLSSQPDKETANIAFVSSMGCKDQNCTDASHYHNWPADCTDYDHYHNCALDCSEAEHHHSQTHHQDDHQTNQSGVITTAFVNGMGCSDQSCINASHHHDCPTDCTDYDHYHTCNLDCAEASHHHSGHGEQHDDNHH